MDEGATSVVPSKKAKVDPAVTAARAWMIAVGRACGFTHTEIGGHLGIVEDTVDYHLHKRKAFYAEYVPQIRVMLQLRIEDRVTDVLESAEVRIRKLFDRSFKLTEKAVKKAEDMGDEITLSQLMEIHRDFTKWSAQFFVSQAPRRMDMNVKKSEEVYHRLDDVTLNRLEAFMSRHQALIPGDTITIEPFPSEAEHVDQQ